MRSFRPFEACWERIKRAETHSASLAEAWNSLLVTDNYTAVVYVYDDGTGRILLSPKYELFEPAFSLDLGEMLYQLRAALDGTIYEAAIIESGQNPPPNESRVEFPLCQSSAQFEKTADGMPLPKKLRDFVEKIQPYDIPKGLAPNEMIFNFNRNLGILHDWARKDRHRYLHIVGSWASNASPKLRIPSGVEIAELNVTGAGFLENESEIATFRLKGYVPGMPVQANPDLMIDIAVNEGPPPCADNDTTGNRLRAMLVTIRTVVGSIEGFYKP
jgi:hypothetical protein